MFVSYTVWKYGYCTRCLSFFISLKAYEVKGKAKKCDLHGTWRHFYFVCFLRNGNERRSFQVDSRQNYKAKWKFILASLFFLSFAILLLSLFLYFLRLSSLCFDFRFIEKNIFRLNVFFLSYFSSYIYFFDVSNNRWAKVEVERWNKLRLTMMETRWLRWKDGIKKRFLQVKLNLFWQIIFIKFNPSSIRRRHDFLQLYIRESRWSNL